MGLVILPWHQLYRAILEMVKFCIQSDEVRMSGEIGITAKFQIITRAKLDSIRKSSLAPPATKEKRNFPSVAKMNLLKCRRKL